MNVNVIGLGYIGLPTALSFAAEGVCVTGTDYNEKLISDLRNSILPFDELGLKELYKDACSNKISFISEAVCADIYIIAVQTPYNPLTRKVDISYLKEAVLSVLSVCQKNSIIAIESTIAPGTIRRHILPLVRKSGFDCASSIQFAHVPERIMPGNMLYELKNNSRTIGVSDKEVGERLSQLYSLFCKGKIVVTTIEIAEITKVMENTYRDINIAYANELSKICHYENIDVYEAIKVANMHPRVNILSPGPGVGGHCISVDPWFLVGEYPDITNVILAARNVNDSQPLFILKRIRKIMDTYGFSSLDDVGFYGLTYKENVNDVRESPTLQLVKVMEDNLAFGVKVYDPYVKEKILQNQFEDFDTFLENIKLLVVMVGHKHLNDYLGGDKLVGKVIFDTRNFVSNINVIKL